VQYETYDLRKNGLDLVATVIAREGIEGKGDCTYKKQQRKGKPTIGKHLHLL
jgi:hypothetical protein